MVISESKKRVMISLTKEQDRKLTDMAKQKGFSKSAVAALAIEEYARKESGFCCKVSPQIHYRVN